MVRVPNREFQDWIQEHYGSLINEALSQLHLDVRKVQYVVEEDSEKKPVETGGPRRLCKPNWILSRSTTN